MATDHELDIVAKTLWGEARGEGWGGLVAVAWTIRNRVETDLHNDGKPDWWGEGYELVCLKRYQYSCWNASDKNSPYLRGLKPIPPREYMRCREAAVAVLEGHEPDPVDGATHYYNPKAVPKPFWADAGTFVTKIGDHLFFKDVG